MHFFADYKETILADCYTAVLLIKSDPSWSRSSYLICFWKLKMYSAIFVEKADGESRIDIQGTPSFANFLFLPIVPHNWSIPVLSKPSSYPVSSNYF